MSSPNTKRVSREGEFHLHQDHEMLISRVDRLEEQMNERMLAMQAMWRDDIREMRQDFASMLKRSAAVLAFVLTTFGGWEWYQIQSMHGTRVDTAQLISGIVQRQVDMVDRLEDLKDYNEKQNILLEEKNRIFFVSLEKLLNHHINNGDHQ